MTGRISVFLALCVLSAAVLVAIALRGSDSEAALSPVPSFHVDIGSGPSPASTGNSYVEDPNGDTNASDQIMSLTTPLTPCVRRDVSNFEDIGQVRIVTDIIIQDAQEMAGADVRFNFDPAQIQFVSATITPFTAASDFVTGFTGQTVGLLNLPVEPFSGGVHRTASPGFNSDNTNGAVFLAGTYLEDRFFKVSSESGPDVDSASNSLPDRNAGQAPDGGVFVRINWNLQAASSGQDVLIDLTTQVPSFTGGGSISVGSAFTTLTGEDPGFTQEIITLGTDDLFDGVVSVNKAIPSPCPPVAGTSTPTATATATPTCDITLTQDDPAAELPGGDHTVTATVTQAGPDECIKALIWVLRGPNAVVVDTVNPVPGEGVAFGPADTGQLVLTYTSNGETGTDDIRGCILPDCNIIDTVFKTWQEPTPTPTVTSTPTATATPGPGTPTATATPGPGTPTATPGPGTPTAVAGAGSVPSTGNPGAAGGSGSDWSLYALASSLLLVAASGGGLLWMSRRRIAWPWRRHQSGG